MVLTCEGKLIGGKNQKEDDERTSAAGKTWKDPLSNRDWGGGEKKEQEGSPTDPTKGKFEGTATSLLKITMAPMRRPRGNVAQLERKSCKRKDLKKMGKDHQRLIRGDCYLEV